MRVLITRTILTVGATAMMAAMYAMPAHAAVEDRFDTFTQGGRAVDPREFDAFSEGARKPDPFTDGARERDVFAEGGHSR
ncbi:hypothetical protein [Cupriavidus sp. BIC8F]|uniref:hypothetical protein n=1 Tax=Cupriavidus sp. BIC8F TaxID=3079014 RepID=UPI002916B19E|nr:hypothetical protein [Cupriavidus sp. BIC8F]